MFHKKYGAAVGLSLAMPFMVSSAALAAAPAPAVPKDFAQGNLFLNPDFDETSSCYKFWEPKVQTDKGVICRFAGSVWLNHNNKAGDPAVAQEVSGLDTNQQYVIDVAWRGGDTAHQAIGDGPKPIFAIKMGNNAPKIFTSAKNITDWKTEKLTFTPSSETMTFEFQGEAGNLDGDVLLGWVSLKPVKTVAVAANVAAARAAVSTLIPEGKYLWQLPQGTSALVIREDGSFLETNPDNGRVFGTGWMKEVDGQVCFDRPNGYCYTVARSGKGQIDMTLQTGKTGTKSKLIPAQ